MPPAALQVLEKLTTLQANAETIVNFLSDGEKVQQLRQDKAYNQQLLQRVRHTTAAGCPHYCGMCMCTHEDIRLL